MEEKAAPSTNQTTPAQNQESQKQFGFKNIFSNKRFLIGGIIVLVLIVLGALFLSKKTPQQEGVYPPADDAMASVGDQVIFRSEVQAMARQQYVQSAITDNVLRNYLNSIIERKILDLEARKLGITVSQKEINDKLPLYANSKQKTVGPNLRDFIKYQILKDKIMAKEVKNVEAYVIGLWIPPLNNRNQKPEYPKMREDAKKAFPEAELKIRNGVSPYEATKYIYANYLSLKSVIVLNGNTFDFVQDPNKYLKPENYVISQEDLKNNPPLYQLLVSLRPNQVKSVVNADGSGGYVVKVISINKDGFLSYDEFLNAKKKELVETYF